MTQFAPLAARREELSINGTAARRGLG